MMSGDSQLAKTIPQSSSKVSTSSPPQSAPFSASAPSACWPFLYSVVVIVCVSALSISVAFFILHIGGYELRHRSSGHSVPLNSLPEARVLKAVGLNFLLGSLEHFSVNASNSTLADSDKTVTDTLPLLATESDSTEVKQEENSVAAPASFVKREVTFMNNLRHDSVQMFWVSHDKTEVLMFTFKPQEMKEWNTYDDHVFVFRHLNNSFIRSIVISGSISLHHVVPDDSALFHEEYETKNGRKWLNVYPRGPVVHHMHSPGEIGSRFTIRTTSPFMHALPPAGLPSDPSARAAVGLQPDGTPAGELELTVETLAKDPRIFLVENFLSDFEAEHIVELAKNSGGLKRSSVSMEGTIDSARTSRSVFLDYDKNPFMANIFRRGFQLMGVQGGPSNYTVIGEHLQVIHYALQQEYSPHHDWFGPKLEIYRNSAVVQKGYNRLATLFLYLNDVESGGETVFPQKDGVSIPDACTHPQGFKVKPKRGRAIIFYSMLPDGNLDDNSLHGGCPVVAGEKWAANWWFWDPLR